MDFSTMTNSQLVAAYNEMATAQGRDLVKRFSTAKAGRKRCTELQALVTKPAVDDLSIPPALRRAPKETAAKAKKAPVKKATVKAKKPIAPRKNGHVGGIIKLLVKENPKRPGSKQFDLYKLYKDGMSVADFRAAAGDDASYRLYWDQKRGFISVK
jgi:hypothetical protein